MSWCIIATTTRQATSYSNTSTEPAKKLKKPFERGLIEIGCYGLSNADVNLLGLIRGGGRRVEAARHDNSTLYRVAGTQPTGASGTRSADNESLNLEGHLRSNNLRKEQLQLRLRLATSGASQRRDLTGGGSLGLRHAENLLPSPP